MAINLSEAGTFRPPLHTQTKDPIPFRLKSTNTVNTTPQKAKLRLTFTAGVSAVNTFELESPLFGRKIFTFLPVAFFPQESGYAIAEYVTGSLSAYVNNVAVDLRLNAYFANYYNITTSGTTIDIEANDFGALYHLDYIGGTSSNMSGLMIITGTDIAFETNMKLEYYLWGRPAGNGNYALRSVTQARPDPNQWFTHDLAEIIHGQTSFNLGPFTTGYMEERALQWYLQVSEIYGVSSDKKAAQLIQHPDKFNFFSYRGGSSRLNTASFHLLVDGKRFLKRFGRTSQTMVRGSRGRYFISVVNKGKMSLKLKVTYTLADTSSANYYAYNFPAPKDSGVYTFEISPRKIATDNSIAESDLVGYVVEAEMDDVLTGHSYSISVADDEFDTRAFWFESSFGVTETIVCKGAYEFGIDVSKDEFRLIFPSIGADSTSRELYQRLNNFTETGTVFTGYMAIEDLRDFVTDLLISENIWTHGESGSASIYRVYIDPESYSLYRKDDFLYGVSFSFKKTLVKQAFTAES